MIGDLATHVVVTSIILAAALAAAAWIRPLTARTRHAILIAGMASLALPATVIAHFLERNVPELPRISESAGFRPPSVILGGLKPAAPQVTDAIAVVWLAIAALLLLRWWIVTRRLVETATRAASAPPPRAVKALDAARRRLGIRHSIDLIASSTCEAPAVVRVLRPMIILPSDGCESLDDEELESLLCHECAHVARRDNLLGVAEAIACSVFWFNPLVWLAHRRIAAAREAACDERVADAALPAETYVGALTKICRALLAPRVPAVSCMASAHLKERIEHLMSYDTLRKSAFSHRAIAATAMLALFLAIGTAGVLTAGPKVIVKEEGRYRLNYSMNKTEAGLIAIRTRVVDTVDNKIVTAPSVSVKPGEKMTTRTTGVTEAGEQREWTIEVDTRPDGGGTMTLISTLGGVEDQRSTLQFRPPDARIQPAYSGQPMSLQLANADIRDVLKTFGDLTGLEITMAPEVQGSISVHYSGTPWDQALDEILAENGLTYKLEGNKMYIFKK